MKFAILLISFVAILLTHEIHGAGKGCAWGGCNYTGGCNTGVTGQSGRWVFHHSKRCGLLAWRGREPFCCDDDCKYQECGKTCGALGMRGDWEGDKPVQDCIADIPGFGEFSGKSHFCCP